MERIIELTVLTVGQFHTGSHYDGGVVKKVGPAEMIVEYPEKLREDSAASFSKLSKVDQRQGQIPARIL